MDPFGRASSAIFEGDILGLPEWWCVASIAFLSFIAAFLVFAYYKGRALMRKKEKATGIRSVRCSACGIALAGGDPACPGCGSAFSKDRFVCPGCGRDTGKDDEKCAYCETRLKKVNLPMRAKGEITDHDLWKLREAHKVKDHEECPSCGALLDPGERCPLCKH